mmetsp:Transcript_1820/g.4920  ORF Transcript_1820/g.4920 Transcript_1820/m.4920 type:complete len:212 (-) Transcript_1820:7-642(-)
MTGEKRDPPSMSMQNWLRTCFSIAYSSLLLSTCLFKYISWYIHVLYLMGTGRNKYGSSDRSFRSPSTSSRDQKSTTEKSDTDPKSGPVMPMSPVMAFLQAVPIRHMACCSDARSSSNWTPSGSSAFSSSVTPRMSPRSDGKRGPPSLEMGWRPDAFGGGAAPTRGEVSGAIAPRPRERRQRRERRGRRRRRRDDHSLPHRASAPRGRWSEP